MRNFVREQEVKEYNTFNMSDDHKRYCPVCYSLLYPDDRECIDAVGACGYCCSYNEKYKKLWREKDAKA